MLDFGFLTLPFIAAAAVFGLALFTGEEISITKIAVPTYLEAKGLNDVIVTRRLSDEIRELNVIAGSELATVDVDGSSLDKSVGELEGYFQLEQLFTGVRDLVGLVPFYVSGELTGEPADLTMTLRVFYKEENRPSDVISVNGNIEGLHDIIQEAALGALEHINPYVVALYWRRIEAAERNFAFPRAKMVIDRYLQNRPVEEHFLAYGLLGRMAMHKAEQTEIPSKERRAAYAEARRYLEAALLQKPDFENANVNLGVLHAVLGDYGRSDAYFTAAVEIDPNDLRVRERWAEALEDQGRARDAAFQWVAAVEIDRDDPALRQHLADAYLILGMLDEARTQIDQAIFLDPTHSQEYRRHLEELMRTEEFRGGRLLHAPDRSGRAVSNQPETPDDGKP